MLHVKQDSEGFLVHLGTNVMNIRIPIVVRARVYDADWLYIDDHLDDFLLLISNHEALTMAPELSRCYRLLPTASRLNYRHTLLYVS